jgi:type II secretory pathway component PulK
MSLLRHNSRGAALLTVLVSIFIMSLMSLELQYTSMVEQRLAYNDLNQLQAYYLAKSGARIGLLRVALYARTRGMQKDLAKLIPGMDLGPILDAIWNLPLPAFPPEKGSLGKLIKKDKDAAEKVLEETKVSVGQTSHVITSEGAKINLNYLQLPEADRDKVFSFRQQPQNLVEYTAMLLINLMEGFIKDSEKPSEEFGDLRPEEQVGDIMDWVNPGGNRVLGGAKDTFYEQQNPPYKAKRGRFFSVEELKLVKGIDDYLYSKLRPHVTVYSYDGKINLNQASKDLYKIIYPDFTEDDLKRVLEEKARLKSWPDEKSFVDFVSSTLGRSGFKSLYPDEKNYPFTTSNYSFLVESQGFIRRSKTNVIKTIKVAVALSRAKGGQIDKSITDAAQCNATKGKFWYASGQTCASKPNNKDECVQLAGGWKMDAAQKWHCFLNNQGPIYPEPDAVAAEPNALKILYWQET